MLDLTQVKNFYEIKWVDGVTYRLKAPSQSMYKEAANLDEEQLAPTVLKILNRNTNGKVFTSDEVNELEFNILVIIVTDYYQFFAKKLEEQVAFQLTQQPQSQNLG